MSVVYLGHTSSMRHNSNYLDILAIYKLNFQILDGKAQNRRHLLLKSTAYLFVGRRPVFSPPPDAMNSMIKLGTGMYTGSCSFLADTAISYKRHNPPRPQKLCSGNVVSGPESGFNRQTGNMCRINQKSTER